MARAMAEPALAVSYAPLPSLVFQCGSCRLICGDTTDLVCTLTCGDLRLVVLKAATDVAVDKLSTRTTVDAGPAGRHFSVYCSGCGSVLGRLYTEAAAGLECLTNQFSFDASKCTSYELGSAEIRVASQACAGAGAGAGAGSSAAAAATAATPGGVQPPAAEGMAVVAELAARVELLEAELTKMQGMVLLHDAQLRQLPMHHGQDQGAGAGLAPEAAADLQRAGGELFASGLQYQAHLRTTMGAGG